MKRTLIALTLLLTACSSGGGAAKETGAVTATGSADAQVATVGMGDDLRFTPSTVDAKAGSLTLTVDNKGLVPHNLQFDDAGLGKTDTIDGKTSATLKVSLSKAGTYTFECTFHPGMTGKVVVS